MNLEEQFIRSIDAKNKRVIHAKQEEPLNEVEKELLVKFRASLNQSKIDPADFNGVYTKEEIQWDLAKVEEFRKKEVLKTERAELLEGIVADLAERYDWFGSDAMTVTLSEYDDRMAHGDIVLEIKNENGEITRILVDVTTSVHAEKIKEKIDMNFSALKDGNKIKYFQSEADQEYIGALQNIPRVVIGISPSTLREMCAHLRTAGETSQKDSFIQLMFLDEIEKQLLYLKSFAETSKGVDGQMLEMLTNSLAEVRNIQDKKKSLRSKGFSQAKANADPVYSLLTR